MQIMARNQNVNANENCQKGFFLKIVYDLFDDSFPHSSKEKRKKSNLAIFSFYFLEIFIRKQRYYVIVSLETIDYS